MTIRPASLSHSSRLGQPCLWGLALVCLLFAQAPRALAQCSPAWVTGVGVPNYMYELALCPNGDLVAGGTSDPAGIGWGTSYVVRWSGSAWSAMGSGNPNGAGNNVRALAVLPNGDVVAAGGASNPNPSIWYYVSRWNGSAWSALGYTDYPVYALAVLQNGDLIAGGAFSSVSGVAANHVARWNGTSWSALGPGVVGDVRGLAVLPAGDLVAGSNAVARWNGSNWSPLGTGLPGGSGPAVMALAALPNGDVAAAYTALQAGIPTYFVSRWNGSAWSILGTFSGGGGVEALAALPNGDLMAGGIFTLAGGVPANRVARWNGAAWSALGAGLNHDAFALAALPNGDLAVGGAFGTAGGLPCSYFARWVTPSAPTISQQPSRQEICTGSAAFSVTAAGAAPLTFQWQRETTPNSSNFVMLSDGPTGTGSIVSGSSTGTLAIAAATPADARRYRCAVTNSCGIATSDSAPLVVNSADFNGDGDSGTDADIEAFFACLAGNCCPTCGGADFNGDGDVGTDADIESFFRVLAGGAC